MSSVPRRIAAAALVAGLVGATAVPPLGASPASAAQPASPTTLTLLDQATWVHPGEELWFRLNVPNAPADAVIDVDIFGALDDRAELTETTAETDPELGDVVGGWDLPLAQLTRSADGTVETRQVIGEGGQELADEGAYPVRVGVESAAGDTLASFVTYLLYVSEDGPSGPELSVSVVVDLGAPPALQPDGTVRLDTASVDEMEGRTAALMQVPDVPVSVAPVPETLDALAESGSAGTELLTDLQTVVGAREVVARPYVDLDLDAMVAAQLLTEVPPEADQGAQVIRNRFVDPRTDQPKEPMGNLWLLDGNANATDANALRDLGVGRAVVPQSAVAPVEQEEGPVPTGPVSLADGGLTGMVADEQLATWLAGSGGRVDAQRFLADLMTIWAADPSEQRGVVVRVPAEANVDPNLLRLALDGLGGSDVLEPTSLSGVFDTVPPAGDDEQPDAVQWTGDGGDPAQLDGLAGPLHAAQKMRGGLAGMLADSTLILSLQRSLLVSLGAQTPDDQRRAYIDRVDAEANGVRDAITAPERFQIHLTSRNGEVPLAIDNSLDQDIELRVLLASTQVEFPEGAVLTVVAHPGRTSLDIPVKTLTSGAMRVRITMASPDGSIVLAESNYVVRSTAISGVGLVLSVGAGAFLLLWWGRHWRTTRRSRRLMGSAAQDGVDPHTM